MKKHITYLFISLLVFFFSVHSFGQQPQKKDIYITSNNNQAILYIPNMDNNKTITIFIAGGEKQTYICKQKDFILPSLPQGTHLIHIKDSKGKMNTITFNNAL